VADSNEAVDDEENIGFYFNCHPRCVVVLLPQDPSPDSDSVNSDVEAKQSSQERDVVRSSPDGGAAPHVGQRTVRAWVSITLPDIMQILFMPLGTKSGQSICTSSKQNAAPSPDSVIQQGTNRAVSPELLTGGRGMLDTAHFHELRRHTLTV